MQHQSNRFFFNVDWITILIFMALCAIGFLNIFSAKYDPDKSAAFSFTAEYGKQLIFIVTALIIGLAILLFDAKFFSVFAPVVYGVTILLLMAVLVVGQKVGGNQAWIAIGSFKLQPSEFAKFGTALLLARYISTFNIKLNTVKPVLIAGAIIILPMGLIMLQPDAGSMLVFLSFILDPTSINVEHYRNWRTLHLFQPKKTAKNNQDWSDYLFSYWLFIRC